MVGAESSKVMLDYKGAGIVERIWQTVNERSPAMLRSVRLEMYWDNAETHAVSAPLGDFFGIGLGRKVPFESEFFSDPEGRSFNCHIPMPFKTAARIVIINDSKTPVTLFYDVNLTTVEKHERPVFYFHTYWNRENKTKLGRDFVVIPPVNGKGRFLGMNVGVIADSIYESSWWGEGEVKMFLDGDSEFPTLVGTGTEDYIGTAWVRASMLIVIRDVHWRMKKINNGVSTCIMFRILFIFKRRVKSLSSKWGEKELTL